METRLTTDATAGRRSQAIAPAASASSTTGRILWIAAAGTLLVTAVFSAFVVTASDSPRSLHAGVAGEAWALSGMSLGLATALLTAGALADDLGHRRVLTWSGTGRIGATFASWVPTDWTSDV